MTCTRLLACKRAPAQSAGDDDDAQAGTAATPHRISLQSTGSETARIRSLSLLASVRGMEARSDDEGGDDDAGGSTTHSGAHVEHSHMGAALRLRRRKRALTVVGLMGVAALWVVAIRVGAAALRFARSTVAISPLAGSAAKAYM